jgi:integrase
MGVLLIELALRYLIQHCPSLHAEQFGPLMLKAVRQEMTEADLCRAQVNKRVGQIKRMFRWAVEEQLVPPSVWHGLQAVVGLKRGRSGARESEPVKPVPEAWVRKTMEHMPPTVAAMVELQMLTGMRPGELCIVRPMDVDRRGKVWLYAPADHKTAFHGHKRVVPIGPRGQEVLRPFLTRGLDAYCFAPDEAQRQRFAVKRANRQTRVQPSQQNRRHADPSHPPGDRYDPSGYGHAVRYAIKAILLQAQAEGRKAEESQQVPDWHPHQLRHTAATVIRREMGLDAARAHLGHRSLGITDTYVELDQALAVEAARKLG